MKKILNTTWASAAAAVLFVGLSPSAKALTLSFESDPDGAGPLVIGSPYAGPVRFIVAGQDAGALYAPLPAISGPTSELGSQVNVAAGITALNGQQVFGAPSGQAGEDSWGIGFIQQILDPATGAVVWSPSGKNAQIKLMFYGGQDFWMHQDSLVPNEQTIAQVNLTIDLYEQAGQAPVPALTGAPADRIALDQYPGFTAPPTTDNLLARFTGPAGFFGAAQGGALAEVVSNFVQSTGSQGDAQGYLSVNPLLGSGFLFDNDDFVSPLTGAIADAQFVFSTQFSGSTIHGTPGVFDPASDWTVSINGPVLTSVPEPTTALTGLACLLPVMGTVFGRRRKPVVSE